MNYQSYYRRGRFGRQTPVHRRKAIRIPGHKLQMEWSGEYGVESSSTGRCICGWTESGSSQNVVRDEYRWHLERVQRNIADGKGNRDFVGGTWEGGIW